LASRSTGTITFVNGAILIGGTHTYANAGYDTVTVTLTDDAPGTASASAISTAKVVPTAPGPNPPVITAMADLASSTEAKGTAAAGTTFNLYDNGGGTAIATGIAANDGTFDIFTAARLAQGVHILTATATDGLNQTSSPSTPVTVIEQYIGQSNYSIVTDVNFTLATDEHYLTFLGSAPLSGTGTGTQNVLTGNTAVDSFTGGPGNNDYYVHNSSDTIIATANSGFINRVYSDVSYTLPTNVQELVLTGSANLPAPATAKTTPSTATPAWTRSSAGAATTPSSCTTPPIR
jgi:hypothetical protein